MTSQQTQQQNFDPSQRTGQRRQNLPATNNDFHKVEEDHNKSKIDRVCFQT
jgi:hypothetical protein